MVYPLPAAISAALEVDLTVHVDVVVSTSVSDALGAALVRRRKRLSALRLITYVPRSPTNWLNLLKSAIAVPQLEYRSAAGGA